MCLIKNETNSEIVMWHHYIEAFYFQMMFGWLVSSALTDLKSVVLEMRAMSVYICQCYVFTCKQN